jgi:hypothetical protein
MNVRLAASPILSVKRTFRQSMSTMMMESEPVSETFVFNLELTQLISRENFMTNVATVRIGPIQPLLYKVTSNL